MTVKLMTPLGPGSSVTALTLTGTYTLQSAVFRALQNGTWAGSGALRTNPSAATGHWVLRGWGATGAQAEMGADTLYTSVALYIAAYPSQADVVFAITNSGSTRLTQVVMATTGTLSFQYINGSDVGTGVGVSAALELNRWYTIEMAVINASSVGGATVEARIDGAVIGTVTNVTVRSGSRTCDRINLGSVTAGTTADFYWTDLVCDDAAYPGNVYVGTLTPDSDVTSQWATGTGTTFAEVDEMDGVTAFDSDTSYLGSSTSGNVATVGLKAITPEKRRIKAVMPFAIWRDEGGSSVLNLRHISGATTTNLGTLDPGASYVMNAAILSTDPATSATWTGTGLDAFVVGAVNGANVAARVTALGAYVAFAPGAGGPGQGGILPLMGAG